MLDSEPQVSFFLCFPHPRFNSDFDFRFLPPFNSYFDFRFHPPFNSDFDFRFPSVTSNLASIHCEDPRSEVSGVNLEIVGRSQAGNPANIYDSRRCTRGSVWIQLFRTWRKKQNSKKEAATAIMSSLMNIAPQKAVLANTGEEVNANEVKVNTRLAVKAGTMIPINGIVVEGKCVVEEKALTGESFPVSKQVDSTVWAGTVNLNAML